jgi:ubiquinone biosynthesis protein UbiJ
MQLPLPATVVIEAAINALLKVDDSAHARRLESLQGKIVDLHLQGLELHIYLLLHAHKIEVMHFFDGEIDVTISGPPLSMASLAGSSGALFSGAVEITGDVEAGKQFKNLLDSIEVDWEEQLSRLTGDIVAHQIGNTVRKLDRTLDRAVYSFSANLGEYLREESRLTPTQGECDHFYTDVDTLRADVDRFDARLRQLQLERNSTS